ncbi:hypothetical protein PX554_01880 [Sphingomonas sp. H39-1-10]|uniref:hypothetical protein n=1 Tax=Sphingomonas TaxID=13687 RepID=UPI00087FAF4C|nr:MULTISPECIES: hypothetical protein [Sphingomonas]MDF0486864.1 hypothetical protein [Sphingomonas pollutisoli]SDA34842.1 hypothetical protein SAMN03159340_03115 [Sphingomonas sp. NFR15]
MNAFLKKAGLGVALAATALTAAMPAEAQWRGGYRGYRGYHGWHRGGDATGAALLGGIVGLGVGAAIASNNRGYDRGYYDGPRGYYAGPPAYYYDDYYRAPRCWSSWRWDPYYGENVRVRVCN